MPNRLFLATAIAVLCIHSPNFVHAQGAGSGTDHPDITLIDIWTDNPRGEFVLAQEPVVADGRMMVHYDFGDHLLDHALVVNVRVAMKVSVWFDLTPNGANTNSHSGGLFEVLIPSRANAVGVLNIPAGAKAKGITSLDWTATFNIAPKSWYQNKKHLINTVEEPYTGSIGCLDFKYTYEADRDPGYFFH